MNRAAKYPLDSIFVIARARRQWLDQQDCIQQACTTGRLRATDS